MSIHLPLTVEIGEDSAAIASARHAVSAALTHEFPRDFADDVVLVVSELVTNAIMHGAAPRTLEVSRAGNAVEIRVHDSSPARPQLRPEPHDQGGFGLYIVERLAAEWGVGSTDTGKTVWCRLGLDGAER
jgi:anti-sigma regulatory factor (Ser/Thr protein kinase)